MQGSADIKRFLLSLFFVGVSAHILFTVYKITQNNKKLEESRAEVLKLETKKENLENQVSYKKTRDYVERTAREELNMSRLGEEIYLYPRDLELKSGLESEVEKEEEQKKDVIGVARKSVVNGKMSDWERYSQNLGAWKNILF